MLDTNLPACLVEHVNLVAGAVRVGYQQAWPNDVEGGINVHWVGVLERENMKPVLVPQVATHPLNTKVVCHLCKDIQIFIPLSLPSQSLLYFAIISFGHVICGAPPQSMKVSFINKPLHGNT